MNRLLFMALFVSVLAAPLAQVKGQGQEVAAFQEPGATPLNQEKPAWVAFVNVLHSENDADLDAFLAASDVNMHLRNGISRTMLHMAVMEGNLTAVRKLLRAGADPNAVDSLYGNTPLHEAALKGVVEIGKMLLEAGARVSVRDRQGASALHMAAGNDQLEFVRLLLTAGANVNARDKEEVTPLHCAVLSGNLQVTEALLGGGAYLEAKTLSAWDMPGQTTPLHIAAEHGNLSIVELLVEKGAQLTSQNEDGQSALNLAYANKHTDVVRYLQSKGAKF